MQDFIFSNSKEAAVEADRGELAEALEILRAHDSAAYRRAIGDDDEIIGAKALAIARVALASIINPGRGSHAALEADIIGLAIGYPGLGGMQDVARKHGLGRAAISKRVVKLSELIGLPPSIYMRDEKTRNIYRNTNTKKRQS